MKTFKVLFASLLVTTLTLGWAAPSIGLTTLSHERTNGKMAIGEWYTEDGDTAHYTLILADSADQGTLVIVQTCDIDLLTGLPTCWTGFAYPSEPVFQMDKRLNMAVLQPTTVELWNDFGTESTTVMAQASWSGVGDPFRIKTNLNTRFDIFQEVYHDRVTVRSASAVGLIDGSPLENPASASLTEYRTADLVKTF